MADWLKRGYVALEEEGISVATSNYHQVGSLWIEHYAKITSAEAARYRDTAKRCFPDAKIVGVTIELDEQGQEHVYANLRSGEPLECM